jgi:hypothetical protein
MGLQNFNFAVITKAAIQKATTLYTSRRTAVQLNTGWLFPLQPLHHCQRLFQIYPFDPDNDRSEREGYR